ncbi:disease resistance protein RGA2-like [Eucalyptus grandis]|uniref:disease resistance protein RGA2-like n=1 Tax=Eucalyptus grandis TaxID=71139 RepID=UPI00192E7C95|nr:disease resistance protein RGA2-like [Eucalyptus grandis]
MAEAVIVDIAGKIVTYLVPQASEKIGKLWGVKHELEKLRNIVSTLRAVLNDAEKQGYQNDQIQVWLDNMKDALYDAQDVLEEFHIEAMQRELRGHNEVIKEVRTFFSSSNKLAFNLKMSSKVRVVRKKIEDINTRRKYHLDERLVDSRVEREKKRKEMHSFMLRGVIRGRDNDKNTVMEFLLDPNVTEDVSILPIVGIGGIGKTALAQCVYNDEMVSKHFHLKMWVCVLKDFDVKKIVTNILTCAKQRRPSGATMELLQCALRAEIDKKRYLLVLDDLWNEEQEKWLSLKNLLVGGARGSKILITTRLHSVAELTRTAPPHTLRELSENASFDLFMQLAFRKEEDIQDPNMRVIGEDIVRKCYGVPLVIRIVGSLLFFKKTTREWLHFKDYEFPKVSQKEDRIKLLLKLTYDHLPSHLKQCFAFCSLFPKDYEIEKQTLVDLWMAEGFIQPSSGSPHLEDIGHEYFMDLLWSNFFQDFKKNLHTNEETCKMHDLMHDLACSVAGTECWATWDGPKPIHKRTRHISYDLPSNLMGELLVSCLKASAPRTFLSVASYEREPTSEAHIHRLIQSFKRLCILDLHATTVQKVPRSIYKLKHLTYLDLSHNDALKGLPNSITRLQNLQTLNLNGCGSLEELPRGIRKLVSLRNLNIDDCDKLRYMPRGLGQLSLLHRLMHFILPKDKALAKKYCGLGELNRLNNIRGSLSIENLESVTNVEEESQAANLREKRSLEILALSWGNFDITDEAMITKRDEALLDGLRPPDNLQELFIYGYNGESFPTWMTELPNLVELELLRCTRCKHFPQSGLSKLKHLDISDMKSLEYLPGECLGSLTSLESLHIMYCPRLTSLPLGLLGLRHLSKLVDLDISYCEELDLSKDESGNIILDFHGLQSLRSLKIDHLPKLESLPQWILQLRSLECLYISQCPNFKELAEQIEKCEELEISKNESGNILDFHGGLQSLRTVIIWDLPKLTSLPQWLLQARNLERLKFWFCGNLKDIPEQIEALQSLQNLCINGCSLLTSFPEAMRRLTSLTHLQISGCGELEESCKRQAGEDWDKIAHIPNIRFD